jgi:cysteine desulfurase family protein
MIYLDNAATSWPKPPEVIQAIASYLEVAGGNPGRSGHRLSLAAGRIVYDTREAVAMLFNAPDPLRVVFTMNATHALNIVLHGFLKPGDRVVTTSMEHNSVMRPLRARERDGVAVAVAQCEKDGTLPLERFAAALSGSARLAVVTHASNVTGTLLPIRALAELAHSAGALLLVDAAQTAGAVPVDMQAMDIDFLACSGHKGLLGPPGTGCLVLGPGVDTSQIKPLMQGGTGSRSEHEEQPEDLPDKFESGTPNGAGIAGLGAGVHWVLARGVEALRAHEMVMAGNLLEGLKNIPGVRIFGPMETTDRVATIAFTVEGRRVSEIGWRLDEEYGVLCRVGLHCAPAAHHTIGTFPEGAIRLAPGPFTNQADVKTALNAIQRIVTG